MQVTKGTWCIREQCVPGSLSSSPAREPGNEAICAFALYTGSASGLASFDLNIGSASRQDHCGYLSNSMYFDNCCLK